MLDNIAVRDQQQQGFKEGKTKEEQNKLQLLMVKPTTTVEWGKLVKEFNTSLIFHIHSKMIQGLMDLILSSLLMFA
ncbi:hypothetical protein MJO28_012423 [Puccinia striiformis f. sp. tritici]|uniref:Uncharacterized protein n=1 Tax=Puccinia striiformis f. sp. tritici TaxID=168172 RepID=A0ACC0E0F9_9BASI|nr:hypothetical protein MJO28_012423 [Puccinia striiformis f. sp. tritici]KAI9610777.1 hypothetical protein KEM48_004753 [Puccinia striiformis f. sp. tritici PST-130]